MGVFDDAKSCKRLVRQRCLRWYQDQHVRSALNSDTEVLSPTVFVPHLTALASKVDG